MDSPSADGSDVVVGGLTIIYTIYALYNKVADRIYIGQTSNINVRVTQHNVKNSTLSGLRYTKKYPGAWVIVYTEEVETRREALSREKQLKSSKGRSFIHNIINEIHAPIA